MRPFFQKLVSVIAIIVGLSVTILAQKSTQESRLIRKAFLDIKRVPPTPGELTWYLSYNVHPYEAAINWLTAQTKTNKLKEYFLSEEYKQAKPVKLDKQTQDLIIKYQSGDINVSSSEADKKLIKLAIICGEENVTDTIDFMSICLIARSTNVQEINSLLKIFKEHPKEENGYLAVLQELKQHKEFIFN